jgi:hypothetical protein
VVVVIVALVLVTVVLDIVSEVDVAVADVSV